MILGLLSFSIANAAVVLGTHAIVRRIHTGSRSGDLLLFLIVRLLLVSALVLIAGLTHRLDAWSLGLAGLVGLAGLLALGEGKALSLPSPPPICRAAWVFIAVVALRLLLQVWFFSPHLGDALAYHLPKVAEWVQQGGFTGEFGIHPHGSFPAGFELVEAWWVLYLRHDVLIEMAGVEFLLLAAVAVYSIARDLAIPSSGALFAALLYVLTPGLHLSATSCLNDTPSAALVVSTAALVLRRAPPALLLAVVGLGLGVKPTYGFALPGLLVLWIWTRNAEVPGPSAASRIPVALATLALATGAYWYLRNALMFGNPFHPLGSSGVDNPVAVQFGARASSLALNMRDLVGLRIYDRAPLGANVDYSAGWGAVPFACGALSALSLVGGHAGLRRLAAAWVVSLACILLFVQNDPWCLKYAFFFPALLCVAAAMKAQSSLAVRAVAASGLAFSFLATLLPYDLSARSLGTLAGQDWRGRTALVLKEPVISDEAVACFGGYRANAYLLYGPDFARRVVYLRCGDTTSLVDGMDAKGVRLLYAVPEGSAQSAALEEAVRDGELRFLGGHLFERTKED